MRFWRENVFCKQQQKAQSDLFIWKMWHVIQRLVFEVFLFCQPSICFDIYAFFSLQGLKLPFFHPLYNRPRPQKNEQHIDFMNWKNDTIFGIEQQGKIPKNFFFSFSHTTVTVEWNAFDLNFVRKKRKTNKRFLKKRIDSNATTNLLNTWRSTKIR